MARRKPGDRNSEKRRRYKRELHNKQEGKCPLCGYFFAMERLKFWFFDETQTYYLVCWGCHK